MAVTYREVTGLWSARIPDGPDGDYYPDTVLLEGRVTLTPEYRAPLVYEGEHVVIEPLSGVIVGGQLMAETLVGEDVEVVPLFLPVTVDDAANQSWSWRLQFVDLRLGEYGEEVTLPDIRFQVPPGSDPLDLSEVAPASQTGGTITVRGPRGPGITGITASGGVVTVEWEGGEDVSIPIPTAALATPTSDGLMSAVDKGKLDAYPVDPGMIQVRDSGERDVTSLIPAIAQGSATISRTGNVVTFTLDTVSLGGLTGTVLLQTSTAIPNGLRPRTRYVYYNTSGRSASGSIRGIRFDRYGGTTAYSIQLGDFLSVTAVWVTDQPWPTTLPGTPA